MTKTYKVYGMDGHRQAETFHPSFSVTLENGTVIDFKNSDKTGTNDYALVTITAPTAEDCDNELDGQITDGAFENYRVGIVKEV